MQHFHGVLETCGATRCEAAPQFYRGERSDRKQIRLEAHMDDFYGMGKHGEVEEFLGNLSEQLDLKISYRQAGDKFMHLKRERLLLKDAIRINPNPRYLEGVTQQLGLSAAKTAPTPSVIGDKPEEGDDEELGAEDASKYRSYVGSLSYFGLDRQDVQFEINQLAKSMSKPTDGGDEEAEASHQVPHRLSRLGCGASAARRRHPGQSVP